MAARFAKKQPQQSSSMTTASSKPKCANCRRKGHGKDNCWAKGSSAEGQGPPGHEYGYANGDDS
ncbi:hypothetical protein AURDEDRAFT_46854, partial [Auricularia subglabra TFB-10046 SS5]